MKLPGMLLTLTVVNLTIVSIVLAHGQKPETRNELPVLRGRGLEIVDDQGRIRASISLLPTDAKYKEANGKPFPETVILRLINSNGRPNVKLSASNEGAALGLGGTSNPTYIQVIADKDETFLNMTNKDGKKRTLKPGTRNGPTVYLPSR